MTLVYVGGNRRRWEIMLMPGDDACSIAHPDSIWRLISRWITPEDAILERAAIYTFHSVIAKGWRKGRLLLAGDACHQTPPFLGQGMCAGIRDCVNLAWKLEAILGGLARDSLLDTYESERSPHVHAFIQLAVDLGGVIQTTDAKIARTRDASFACGGPRMFDFPQPQLGPGVWISGGTRRAKCFRSCDWMMAGAWTRLQGVADSVSSAMRPFCKQPCHSSMSALRPPEWSF
jgi:3-(3-hydroxy-phenyl)propionate hydroxylase